MENLKKSILDKKPSSSHVLSSFAIVCAHVWTSLARSAGEEVADDEPEYFSCAADCRGRLNPPLPATYFGNCLTHVLAESTHGRLKGDRGIVVAAEVITEAIQKANNINEKGVLDGSHKRLIEMMKLMIPGRVLGVSGSPRLDLDGADFGWGRPNKFDIVNLYPGLVCLSRFKEFKGGVQIELFMPEVQMNAFAASFNQGLIETRKNNSRL